MGRRRGPNWSCRVRRARLNAAELVSQAATRHSCMHHGWHSTSVCAYVVDLTGVCLYSVWICKCMRAYILISFTEYLGTHSSAFWFRCCVGIPGVKVQCKCS